VSVLLVLSFAIDVALYGAVSLALWLFARNYRGRTSRWWFFAPFLTFMALHILAAPILLLFGYVGVIAALVLASKPLFLPLWIWVGIGFAVFLIVPPRRDALTRACPHCAEQILRKAKVCPYCRRDVPAFEEPRAGFDAATFERPGPDLTPPDHLRDDAGS